MAESYPWSAAAPIPAAAVLSDGYHRHAATDAEVKNELGRLTTSLPWSEMGWFELIDALLAVGRTDIPLARLAEGHADAQRIFAQAGLAGDVGAIYGVWASRSQQTGVTAERSGTDLVLNGTLRFASGIGVLDRALVPVWPSAEHHLLLDVPVADLADTAAVDRSLWVTAAMAMSRSHTITLDDHRVPMTSQVGDDDFYLTRPGFFPGGVGVAACWLGGAARVADLVRARLRDPLPPALQQRLGKLRAQLATGAAVLAAATRRLSDADPTVEGYSDGRAVATEARFAVAAAVHQVLDQAHRIAGPAGLAYDEDLTHAVHDLRLYVLQSNADADAAYLGRLDPG
ncbi:MAG: acyl-CoA dehydrogenase family protein [Propionibacteriaceae bacterium]